MSDQSKAPPPKQNGSQPRKVDENVQEEAAKERAENEGYD